MPQNNNAKSLKVYESIKNNIDEQSADLMARTITLSKSANTVRTFKWAVDVCSYLENNFDDEQIIKIRMGCACSPSNKYLADVKKLYNQNSNLDEFSKKYNEIYAGKHSVLYDGENLFFCYPNCYCSCVKNSEELISKTWCICTLGYTKKLFDYVLGQDTKIELIESVKTGGEKCLMKIIW